MRAAGRTELTCANAGFQTSQRLLDLSADRESTCLAFEHSLPLLAYLDNTARQPKTLPSSYLRNNHGRGNRPLRYLRPFAHTRGPNSLTFIEVLNIQRSATKAEIKKAYHKVNNRLLPPSPKGYRLTFPQGCARIPPRQGPRRAARRSRRKVQGRLASLRSPQRRAVARPLR